MGSPKIDWLRAEEELAKAAGRPRLCRGSHLARHTATRFGGDLRVACDCELAREASDCEHYHGNTQCEDVPPGAVLQRPPCSLSHSYLGSS